MKKLKLYGDRTILRFELKWPVRRMFFLKELYVWDNILEKIPGIRTPNSIKIGRYMLEMLKPDRF